MSVKSLFTDNLPADLKGIVQCIPDGGATTFRSKPTTYDEGGKGWVNYDLAWKLNNTGLWTIETNKGFIEDGKITARQKKTVARNVSFFDALYHCAHGEMSRKASGQEYYDDGKEIPHFSAVAKKAKQPLDMNGVPQPAAEGHILTDGIFDEQQSAIAEDTRDIPLPSLTDEQSRAMSHSVTDTLSAIDITQSNSDAQGIVTATQTMSQVKSEKAKIESLVQSLTKKINSVELPDTALDTWAAYKRSFAAGPADTIFFTFMGGIMATMIGTLGGIGLGLGASFAIGMDAVVPTIIMSAVGLPVSIPFWRSIGDGFKTLGRNRAFKKLDKTIASMPESSLKQAMKEFRLTAEANFHFRRAAQIIEKHGYESHRKIKQVFKHVAKGADILELSEIEKTKLQSAVLDEKFPSSEHFEEDTKTRRRRFTTVFKATVDEVFKDMSSGQPPLKALEHKPEMTADDMLGTTVKEKAYEPK